MLSHNRIDFSRLLSKLRYKYEKLKETEPEKAKLRTEQLNNVIWRSAWIVYPNYEVESRQITRAKDARKRKKNRVNRYIRGMFDSYDQLYFVTLTWSDTFLNGLKPRTRKNHVREWLELNSRDFLANVDFGKKNHREHYHALVAPNKNETFTEWEFGFSKIRKFVKPTDGNPQKISAYILKLVNHANKVDTGSVFRKKSVDGFFEVDELPF